MRNGNPCRAAAEAEEARKEAERLARIEAKAAKKEELRKAGKLLTAKQRAEAARLALVREKFLATAKVRTSVCCFAESSVISPWLCHCCHSACSVETL